jgi:hypothetical protein
VRAPIAIAEIETKLIVLVKIVNAINAIAVKLIAKVGTH